MPWSPRSSQPNRPGQVGFPARDRRIPADRGCLDHLLIHGEWHLRRILAEYAA
jgi:hypothetical protein